MGRGVYEEDIFESGRALLEVVDAEDFEGKTRDGDPFAKLNAEYKVIEYEEQDEDGGEWIGHTFTDGAYYKNGGIPKRGNSKIKRMIEALKGEDYLADLLAGRIEFNPEDIIGERLRGQVEESERGYSTVVWNTISGVKRKPRKKNKAKRDLEDLERQTAEDLEVAELAKDENNPLMQETA